MVLGSRHRTMDPPIVVARAKALAIVMILAGLIPWFGRPRTSCRCDQSQNNLIRDDQYVLLKFVKIRWISGSNVLCGNNARGTFEIGSPIKAATLFA